MSEAVSGHKNLIGNYMDDIDKVINGEKEKETPAQPTESEKTQEQKTEEEEIEKRKQQIVDLDAAKGSLEAEVQRLRTEKRELAKKPKEGDDEVPQIDDNDPSAKAWNKRINETVTPVQKQVDQARAEIRQFAFDRFLADKPSLAKSPEKIKELMATYEKIRTASEATTEGVLLDLDKAYAATFHKELLEVARQGRVDNAKNDAIFSDIAVSRGSTAYPTPKAGATKLSDEDKLILSRWGMTPEEWAKMKAEVKEQ